MFKFFSYVDATTEKWGVILYFYKAWYDWRSGNEFPNHEIKRHAYIQVVEQMTM